MQKEIEKLLLWLPDLTEENTVEKFKFHFLNWSLEVALAYENPYLAAHKLKHFSKYGIFLLPNTPLEEVGYHRFMLIITETIEQYIDSEIPEAFKQKALKYRQWLLQNEKIYRQLDALIKFRHDELNYRSIHPMIKLITGQSVLVDPVKLNSDLIKLWKSADEKVLQKWLTFEEQTSEISMWYDFNFDYYLKPLAYEQFPEYKSDYFRLLIAYISDELFKRKSLMGNYQLPSEYLYIEAYKELIEEALRKHSLKKQRTSVEIPNATKKAEEINYPRHIFLNEKAYLLFVELLNNAEKVADVSFIYCVMSEKERPQLIVVRDVPFRDWYAQNKFPIALRNTTTVFYKCTSNFRIMWYNNTKKLIMSN